MDEKWVGKSGQKIGHLILLPLVNQMIQKGVKTSDRWSQCRSSGCPNEVWPNQHNLLRWPLWIAPTCPNRSCNSSPRSKRKEERGRKKGRKRETEQESQISRKRKEAPSSDRVLRFQSAPGSGTRFCHGSNSWLGPMWDWCPRDSMKQKLHLPGGIKTRQNKGGRLHSDEQTYPRDPRWFSPLINWLLSRSPWKQHRICCQEIWIILQNPWHISQSGPAQVSRPQCKIQGNFPSQLLLFSKGKNRPRMPWYCPG